MGANSSDPNNNEQIAKYLDDEIQLYKNGSMEADTTRYQFFIMNASQMIKYDKFYKELTLEQINEYFKDVKVFDKKEASTIIKKIYQISDTDEEANSMITQVMPNILCPFKKSKNISYISPCCSQELFNDVIKKNSSGECGKYKPINLFDFNSNEMIELREMQERSIDQPKFQHSEDIGLLIIEHPLDQFIDMPIQNIYNEDKTNISKEPKKPFLWEKNIFKAAINGDVKSFKYNIYFLPYLRDIRNQNGESLGHLASKNGRSTIISALIEMNADLNDADNDGNLPIHLVSNKSTFEAFIAGGYSYDMANRSGDLLIEIKSHPFNSKVIDKIIRLGTNILVPNSKGIYWMQYVIHNSYYPSTNQYVDFQKFVRKIINEIDYPFYKENDVIQKVLQRSAEVSEIYDAVDLRNEVINGDVEKVKTLLAIGTVADNKMYNKTNLMISSEMGNIEIARLLATNFCDPNILNHKGQNSFWLASQNKHFDVATMLLKDFNANPNIVSKLGQTLLHIAYKEHDEDLFNFLLESGASPNVKNSENQTLQFIAFSNNDDEIAERIQNNYKGDINTTGKDGNSLGHLALINNDFERFDYLLERKLDINVRNDSGQSLLMWTIINTDNLSLCQKMIDLGANIDSQDNEGNSAFYCICKNQNFSSEKFDFLIKNKCDINIQNNAHDFPISQLIMNGNKEKALLLLSKGANIIDSDSPTEPIVIAVKMHDQFWTNKLIDNHANAMNKTYPLVEMYIKESFFDFEYLKKMDDFNLSLGTPIQSASQKSNEAAVFLWNQATEDEKLIISNSVDEYGFIPLIAAIYSNNDNLFTELIDEKYNITKTDYKWRTPFMHACIANNTNFIFKLFKKLPLEEVNKIDKDRNSALTYVCNNNNKKVADFLFINDVNLMGMNLDNNGMILFYINRVKEVEKMIHVTCIQIHLKSLEDKKIQQDLKSEEFSDKFSGAGYAVTPTQNSGETYGHYQDRLSQFRQDRIDYLVNDSSRRNDQMNNLRLKAARSHEELRQLEYKLSELKSATRKTMLYYLKQISEIA